MIIKNKIITSCIILLVFSCNRSVTIDGYVVAPCNCHWVEGGMRLSDEFNVGKEKSYVGRWKKECEKLKQDYTKEEWDNYLNNNCW